MQPGSLEPLFQILEFAGYGDPQSCPDNGARIGFFFERKFRKASSVGSSNRKGKFLHARTIKCSGMVQRSIAAA
jgi:hypothetical protein